LTIRHRIRPALTGSALIALLVVCPGAPVYAETAYISDELTVPLRTGASSSHRILRILPAGTTLEVRQRDADAGYAQVLLRDGTEGWVPEQYLVATPIARDRLETATREVQRLTATVSELREQLRAVQGERGEAQQSTETLSAEVSRLQAELAEVRRMSAAAIETDAANRELTSLNTRLREELDALVEERDRLVDNAEQRWLMIGGGLVLLGLLLGAILKARPRRSAWS
jgi:SH3 domain protein